MLQYYQKKRYGQHWLANNLILEKIIEVAELEENDFIVTTAIDAFIESGDFDIADWQPFLHIGRGIPNFKDLTGTVDITLRFKTYPSSTTPTTVTRTITPTTEKFDLRGRGRQANIRIDSDAVGDKWRYGTLRLDVQPDGGR